MLAEELEKQLTTDVTDENGLESPEAGELGLGPSVSIWAICGKIACPAESAGKLRRIRPIRSSND